jgi:hypothetical protein
MSPELSIIIVNMNTRELVCQCLDSIYANPPKCEFEVIVVDNASVDGSCEAIGSRCPAVRIVRNSWNMGFAVANNRALEVARGAHLLLLNSDTIVLPGSLDALVSAMNRDESVGAVGPKLIFPDGSPQMGYGPMPSLFGCFCSFFDLKRWVPRGLLGRLAGPARNGLLGKSAGSYVKWFSGEAPGTAKLQRHLFVFGACMLIRRECFKQVGLFDPGFFMYVEDADYCKRIYDAGWAVQYLAEATVVHIRGGTGGKRYRWTSPAPYFSAFYFMEKHRGRVTARATKVIALASLALRFIVKAVVAPRTARSAWDLLCKVAARPRGSPIANLPTVSRWGQGQRQGAD